MPFVLQDPLQADARVLGVLDDDDTPRRSHGRTRPNRCSHRRRRDHRQAKPESGAGAQTVALRLDAAAVQLDDTPHQSQPNPKAASFAFGTLVSLEEELECTSRGFGVHTRTVVADGYLHRVRERVDAHVDSASLFRVCTALDTRL